MYVLADFLLPDGGAWDEDKLRMYFYDQDVSDILCTQIGRAGQKIL
jgi:hypothetical protein